jgi:alcohol dehydrogenase (cytochrome c)
MSYLRKLRGVYPACIGLGFISGIGAPAWALGPSQAELDQSAIVTENWLMTNKSYDGHRYVSLDQINTRNVRDLHEICTFDSGVAAPAQSAPVLYNRRIFLSVGQTTVVIDATSCKEIWRYEWTLKDKALSTQIAASLLRMGVWCAERPMAS